MGFGFQRNNRFYFTYSGRPGGYSIVSMADVLDGTVNPAIFQDAVVLVGAYAVGMQDAYMPAIAHNSQMYGVEIHANIIEALLEGKTQLPISPLLYALAAALLLLAACGGKRDGTIRVGVALYRQDDTFITSLSQYLQQAVLEEHYQTRLKMKTGKY